MALAEYRGEMPWEDLRMLQDQFIFHLLSQMNFLMRFHVPIKVILTQCSFSFQIQRSL